MRPQPTRIYLDHAATTPVRVAALEAMRPWLSDRYGNPSSIHEEGRAAKAALDSARDVVARALGCTFGEITFTSSGTEAANLAVIGAALGYLGYGRTRVLVSAAEHHCVLRTAEMLGVLGYSLERIPVDKIGRISLDALEAAMADDVLMVAAMHANNELGTIQPVAEVSRLAQEHGALFFCDAVQTFLLGLPERWTVDDLNADLVAVSAHKIGGPKGVGALYVRAGVKTKALLRGGGQERDLRAGTEDVAGIVGMSAAVSAVLADDPAEVAAHKRQIRDQFLRTLEELLPGKVCVTVPNLALVLPGHAHVRIEGVAAEPMLVLLDMMGVAASSGAACSSGSLEPSHVLMACGYSQLEAKQGLRFTVGNATRLDEAEEAARRVARAAAQIARKTTLMP